MAAVKTRGREERKRTRTGRARTPALDRFYRYALPAIAPGDFRFELMLLRPHLPPFSLDRSTESFMWTESESSSVMTGNLQLHRPVPDDPVSLPIHGSQRVRARVKWAGSWYELWTMRVKSPQVNLDENLVSVDLIDDMDLIKRTKRDWSFRQTKRRRFGYFPEEVVRLVCRRAGIRMGAIAKGRYRVPGFHLPNASPYDVFRHVYAHEREKTGRRFVIRMRNGHLEVVPRRRNPLIYVLEKQIQTAMLTQEAASEEPATVLTGRGRIGSGKDTRPVSYTDYARTVVERLGYVHKDKDYGRVSSHAELRSKVQRDLAAGLRTNRTASVQYQGIPFIRTGEGAKLMLPLEGFSGDQAFVYATTATHNVSAASYNSSWDFTTDDPFVKLRHQAEAEQRAAKRRERKRHKIKAVGKA